MKALNDTILLEIDEAPVATEGGIIIPEAAQAKFVGPIAKILDIGPDVEMDIEAGDWVLCGAQYITNTVVKGVSIRYCRPVGIMAKLTQDEIDAEIVPIKEESTPIDIVPACAVGPAGTC